MSTTTQKELLIVGGGIAGLTTAELFQRSGWQVTLIEKEDKLCQNASGKHHEWFHLGSLYASFNTDIFIKLIENAFIIMTYYQHMPGMNMSLVDNQLVFQNRKLAWFRDEAFNYYLKNLKYDRNTFKSYSQYVIDWCKWKIKNIRFFSCHSTIERDHKYFSFILSLGDYLFWSGPANKDHAINFKTRDYLFLRGLDRTMNSRHIVHDLINSFIVHGGQIKTGHQFLEYKHKNKRVAVSLAHGDEKVTLSADRIILTMGNELNNHLKDQNINIVISPLLVAYPHVYERNFVVVADQMSETINHLHHRVNDRVYSVIGGGYFANPNDRQAIQSIKQDLIDRAKKTFIKLKDSHQHLYISYKTEILSANNRNRNYVYQIKKRDNKVWYAVPGKASLAFSLALDLYKKLNRKKTPNLTSSYERVDRTQHYFGHMLHARVASELMNLEQGKVVNQ